MARKAFFAAFVIDEEAYTPEPGPVDRHFVVSDLAQSNFGEQPGVSNFIVWDTLEQLIADHRRHQPTLPNNFSDGEPADRASFARAAEICTTTRTMFRDYLSPAMRAAMAFEYYEVRPCIERYRQIASYADEKDYAADLTKAQASGKEFRTFWSLYGIDAGAHTAIGDFVSKDAAHEVMNAILAVPAAARNAIHAETAARSRNVVDGAAGAQAAADWLDDMINQCSNDQRI